MLRIGEGIGPNPQGQAAQFEPLPLPSIDKPQGATILAVTEEGIIVDDQEGLSHELRSWGYSDKKLRRGLDRRNGQEDAFAPTAQAPLVEETEVASPFSREAFFSREALDRTHEREARRRAVAQKYIDTVELRKTRETKKEPIVTQILKGTHIPHIELPHKKPGSAERRRMSELNSGMDLLDSGQRASEPGSSEELAGGRTFSWPPEDGQITALQGGTIVYIEGGADVGPLDSKEIDKAFGLPPAKLEEHPDEVSLEATQEAQFRHKGRNYPTFGAPTHWDQDQ